MGNMLDLTELVQRSDHIAVAEVLSVPSAWDAKGDRILSTITLSGSNAASGLCSSCARPSFRRRSSAWPSANGR